MKLMNKDEFLANELRFYFIKNQIKEGEKLPSERELCETFHVQRATVRSAYNILEQEGIIEIRERSGRYMGHARISTNLKEICSLSKKISNIGKSTESKLISYELMEVDKEMSKKIKLPIGTALNKITRIRYVRTGEERIPIAIEYAYIPDDIASRLMRFNLEERSLFEILSTEYGKKPKREEQKIEVAYADEFEAKTLAVNKMTALVLKRGLTYDEEGNILQYIHAIMNKDWIVFEDNNPVIEQKVGEGLDGL